MNKDTEVQTLNPVALIKSTLEKFTRLYAAFNDLSADEVVKRINSGDCGLTAIAVHHVLKEKYKLDVQIVLCRSHCWLHHDGVDYDTKHPEGYQGSAADEWEKEVGAPVHPLTFAEACEEWMPCDVKGAFIVKAFCLTQWVNFPPELQHCFDNADEYERPGEREKYEEHMQSVLANL